MNVNQRVCARPREHSFQLFELYFRAVFSLKTSCMFNLLNYRVKRAVCVVRRAMSAKSDMRLLGDAI